MTIQAGRRGEARRTVTQDMTAEALGSGDVPVLGTPAVLALIEEAAVACVREALEPGQTTVGSRADLKHIAPSAVGAEVHAVAELTEVDGRSLTFECIAYEDDQPIATAVHTRAVVERDRFLERL